MKNTLIISDVHGRQYHKQMLNNHPEIEKIVFLGDYFDSYDIPFQDQIANFLDIMALKESGKYEVITLFGNHDGYLPQMNHDWSGYQSQYANIIWMAMQPYIHHLQICHRDGQYLFSHAGISQEWLFNNLLSNSEWDNPKEIDLIINMINDYLIYKPKVFDFGYFASINVYVEESGDDEYQGPLWIRPRALKKSNYEHWLKSEFIQIVGHTGVNKIDFEGKSTGGRYYFIDTQHTVPFEYLTIIDEQLKLNTFYG